MPSTTEGAPTASTPTGFTHRCRRPPTVAGDSVVSAGLTPSRLGLLRNWVQSPAAFAPATGAAPADAGATRKLTVVTRTSTNAARNRNVDRMGAPCRTGANDPSRHGLTPTGSDQPGTGVE